MAGLARQWVLAAVGTKRRRPHLAAIAVSRLDHPHTFTDGLCRACWIQRHEEEEEEEEEEKRRGEEIVRRFREEVNTDYQREGDAAVIVHHHATDGRACPAIPVRKWSVGDVEPYAQHERTVRLYYTEPRKRNGVSTIITSSGEDYVTVEHEHDRHVLYDSRADVPCDMEKWEATAARFKDSPGMGITHHAGRCP